MTPQSKAEAARLANLITYLDESPIGNFPGETHNDRCKTAHEWIDAIQFAADYIEANPAISADDRARARELADKHQSVKNFNIAYSDDQTDTIRLLRLIAGPEEPDPLADAIQTVWVYPKNCEYIPVERAQQLRTALHQAGYEITPITKQEGDHA